MTETTVAPETGSQPQSPEQPKTTEASKPVPQIRCGYSIILFSDGSISFDTAGNGQGIIELLGLHTYAGQKIQTALDVNQNTGSAVTREILRSFRSVFVPQSGERSGAK